MGAPDFKDMLTTPTGLGVGAGLLIVFGALAFFMMKGKGEKTATEKPVSVTSVAPAAAPSAPEIQEEVAVAAQKIVVSDDPRKEQLTQIARDYHDATVRIIRTWLHDDPHKGRANNGDGAAAELH